MSSATAATHSQHFEKMTCHHELIALKPIVMFGTITFFSSVIREKQLFTYNHKKQANNNKY